MAYNKLDTPTPTVVTPTVDGSGTTTYSKSHWDKRPQKYNEHTFRKVVVYVYMIITLNNLASFGLNQALKLFFMKLGWSNAGSNAMKATFDAVSAFSVMFGSYLADEYVGKWKMIFGAVVIDVIGMAMMVISSLPAIVDENQMLAKVLFNVGLFLAVCQVHMMMTQLVYSFGADQFSPDAPAWKKPVYFNGVLWAVCLGVTISYALLPTVVTNGIGAIPRQYGFTANFAFTLICVVLTVIIFTATRKRYVKLPPTKNSVSQVLRVLFRHARRSFKTALIIIAAALYTLGFLGNVLAAFLDLGIVSLNVAKLGGLLIAIATLIWIFVGRDPSFMDSAKDDAKDEAEADFVDSVKRFVRLLPMFAINAIWVMVQNQRGNNQTIIQQTDVRLTNAPDSAQIPAQTIMIILPLSTLLFIPLCEKFIYPAYERITGKPSSRFGRIATGYLIGAICMFWTGILEIIRRSYPLLTYVDATGVTKFILNKDGKQPMSSLGWYATAPQLLINSFANTLIFGTIYDLSYTEVPQTLTASSFSIGLFSSAMGNTMLSVCVLLWRDYIPANLNNGNMEYLFFTYGGLMLFGLAAFLVVMRELELGTIPKDYKKKDLEMKEDDAARVCVRQAGVVCEDD